MSTFFESVPNGVLGFRKSKKSGFGLNLSNPSRSPKWVQWIRNPFSDLPKGTENLFLDLKSGFGFDQRNTPLEFAVLTKVALFHFLGRLGTGSSAQWLWITAKKVERLRAKANQQRKVKKTQRSPNFAKERLKINALLLGIWVEVHNFSLTSRYAHSDIHQH